MILAQGFRRISPRLLLLVSLLLPCPLRAASVQLPATGQTSCYNAAGDVIDCAGSGQDGALQSGVAWPTPRFVNNGDGTLTDNLTGLVWLKNAGCLDAAGSIPKAFGNLNWNDALLWSDGLASGICGLTDGSAAGDWRLPSIRELRSLVNRQELNPVAWLESQGFDNVAIEFWADYYWTSNTYAGSPAEAWNILMEDGSPWVNKKQVNIGVWPVRYPHSATKTLTVYKTGTGTGTVTADGDSLDWVVATATASYPLGTVVDLAAVAENGSVFVGWGGACSGIGTCQVTLDAVKQVTAEFREANAAHVGFEPEGLLEPGWSTYGDKTWTAVTESHSGQYAMRGGGHSGDGTVSVLALNQATAAGTGGFWFKLGSQQASDFLRFYIDDELHGAWSGSHGWTEVLFPVAAGVHTFRWEYRMGTDNGFSPPNAVWIDDVVLPGAPAVHSASPVSLTVPAIDYDGLYRITWGASTTPSASYTLEESTSSDFTANLQTVYSGVAKRVDLSGRDLATRYYYRVKATRPGFSDSDWVVAANPVAVAAGTPGAVTAPGFDADGSYTVSWVASATPGVTYLVHEATDITFASGLKVVYNGSGTSVDLSGRASGVTYYYRVRASIADDLRSNWATRQNGCAIPGSSVTGAPGAPQVPTGDADGSYTVSWDPSATAEVNYVLYEATNDTFSKNLKIVYYGPDTSFGPAGRVAGTTYYYRVRATKAGLRDSAQVVGANGCLVVP